jgi:acyl-CoA reductase-like NAD-dependent aldehyde dehydrogenase
MLVMTDETFGPLIPVMAFDTIDEAIRLANDSIYGLSAAVMAGSMEEAEAIGRQLEVGAVSLNDCSLTTVMHEAEKNSFKLSGLGGSRMGATGYLRFFRTKALLRQTGTPATVAMLAEENAPR